MFDLYFIFYFPSLVNTHTRARAQNEDALNANGPRSSFSFETNHLYPKCSIRDRFARTGTLELRILIGR